MSRIKFLNIQVDNLKMQEAVERVEELIRAHKCSYVVTPNMDHIVTLEVDKEFKEIYENADLILTDGKPLIWISRLFGNPIVEKVSGSDLFPEICKRASKKGYRIYILGGDPGVAQKAARRLSWKYPDIHIVGTYSPPFGFENDLGEVGNIIASVKKANPDILAVSLGSPKGETFIYRYCQQMQVPVSMSIGATVDFIAGNVKRAPKWMSDCGLEWLYRIIQEPGRLTKRYWHDAVNILPIIWKYRRERK